jgi:hypothetical protein
MHTSLATYGKLKIIDILNDSRSEYWATALFEQELHNIRTDASIPLAKNYYTIDLNDFYSFTLLTTSDRRLIAFSGLQKSGPWSQQVARISSRFRIAKDFQTHGLMGRGYDRSIFSGSKYLMPYQLGVAISLGLSGVFLSRENIHKRRHLQSMTDRFNEFESRTKYVVYPHAVNTCRLLSNGTVNDESGCWQNAIVAKLNDDFSLGLPEKRLDTP